MPVEDRNISDLADPSRDLSRPDTQSDYRTTGRVPSDVNNGQAFTPQYNEKPYTPPIQVSLAGIVLDKISDTQYRVLTQKNRIVTAFALSEQTYEASTEVTLHTPNEGDVWIIVGNKKYREEQYVKYSFSIVDSVLTLTKDEEALTEDPPFYVANATGFSLDAGYYDIRVKLDEPTAGGGSGSLEWVELRTQVTAATSLTQFGTGTAYLLVVQSDGSLARKTDNKGNDVIITVFNPQARALKLGYYLPAGKTETNRYVLQPEEEVFGETPTGVTIQPNTTGTVDLEPTGDGVTIQAKLASMHNDQPIEEETEVLCRWSRQEFLWRIVGSGCNVAENDTGVGE